MSLLRPLIFCLLAAFGAQAAPVDYQLDVAKSQVGFTYDFTGQATKGTMPVTSANMRLDLKRIAASTVSVTLDPSRAKAGFAFATQAMTGPKVLDTARHPRITFRSTAVRGTLQNATVDGILTVRGVAKPVTLNASLYRQRGTDPTSQDRLSVLLTGAISRAAFGATGWPKLVGDRIDLRILAQIKKR